MLAEHAASPTNWYWIRMNPSHGLETDATVKITSSLLRHFAAKEVARGEAGIEVADGCLDANCGDQ